MMFKLILIHLILLIVFMFSCKTTEISKLRNDCKSGILESCIILSKTEFKTGNTEKAKALFEEACSKGDKTACTSLGALEIGLGNKDQAKNFLTAACTKDSFIACYGLAELEYESGNYNTAISLYNKSCAGGYIDSCWEAKHKLSIPQPQYHEK